MADKTGNPEGVASRFPGLDPFVEGQAWPDFHTAFISALRDALVPMIVPRYVAVIEERVYLEPVVQTARRGLQPDVTIVAHHEPSPGASPSRTLAPVTVPLAMPEQVVEKAIEIRLRDGREVVCVIELLSPANKRLESQGRKEYLSKRDRVLRSEAHLVELDFLRGGERLPMGATLPVADAYAIVSRVSRRPLADVWPIPLRQTLPVIDIPLAGRDEDVRVDLQTVFTTVYDRARYDVLLDYTQPPRPPLAAQDIEWVAQTLAPA